MIPTSVSKGPILLINNIIRSISISSTVRFRSLFDSYLQSHSTIYLTKLYVTNHNGNVTGRNLGYRLVE